MTTGQPLAAVAPELASIARGSGSGDTFPLLDVADLERLPPPDWLLEEFIPAGGLAVLFGPSGIGKSFLAKDWALCVAEGLAWYGKPAKSGWVLYIAAEGRAGLGVRVRAWMNARRRSTVERIRFLPEAVNFLDRSQLDRAARTLKLLPEAPALIAIDTMARTMIGGDENAARDVGLFIAAVDELCAGSNAARLIVHHTGKNGEDERGSSALRGAADVMHALRPDGGGLRLECVKSKDAEPYHPWRLRLEPADESCVIAVGLIPTVWLPQSSICCAQSQSRLGLGRHRPRRSARHPASPSRASTAPLDR